MMTLAMTMMTMMMEMTMIMFMMMMPVMIACALALISYCILLKCHQIEECTIKFNATITSSTTMALEGRTNSANTGSASASASYSMTVIVKAKQAPIPQGMARIFDVLDKAISDKNATAAASG
jgi:hypothetical protein